MHHSADSVNASCLRHSVPPCDALSAVERRGAPVTWDVNSQLRRCQDAPSDPIARDDGLLRPTQRSRVQRGQEQAPPDRRLTHSAWLEHCYLPVWTPESRCGTCKRLSHAGETARGGQSQSP